MKRKNYATYCFFIFYLLFLGENILAQPSQAVKVFVGNKSVLHAGISFNVIDLNTGNTVVAYNEDRSLTSASTMKLVSTAAALDFLHPDYQYKTPLLYSGEIDEKGVLTGNLYIAAAGDPTLGSEYMGVDREAFLKEWLAALQKAGIQKVTGSVIVLDQEYTRREVIPSKWLWEDLGNYYAPGNYGISVFDNTYQLFLTSGEWGEEVKIAGTKPEIDSLYFVNDIRIVKGKSNDVYINGIPYSYERRLSGVMKENQNSFMIKGEIPDPALFLAKTFSTFLNTNRIIVNGNPGTSRLGYPTPDDLKELSVAVSPFLAKIIEVANVKSNNHYAESLSRTFENKSRMTLTDFWAKQGLDTEGQFIYDGSGLSVADAISARFLTDILIYMDKKSKYAHSFYRSLPVAGREGTVASFLQGTALEGKARIKSGSMTNVQSYAGYVEKENKRFAFAIIVNHFTGKRADLKKEIEQLLLSVF